MQSRDTQFRLSLFCKEGKPLSKKIALGDDGQPVSDGSECNMAVGNALNLSLPGLNGLSEIIGTLNSEQALVLGTITGWDDSEIAGVVIKKRLSGNDAEIARTKDYLGFETGTPAFMLIDFDQKGMPAAVRERINDAGDVWELICSVFPELANAGHLRRTSTSAGLYNAETKEKYPESGGQHIYVAVQDASDIPRATKALHQRLYLEGLGWIRLGKVGQLLERSIVDQSVGSPERLVFEGAPVLVPPLVQSEDARRPVCVEGGVVETRTAIPNLSVVEQGRLRGMLESHKAELKPKAKKLQKNDDSACLAPNFSATNFGFL